MTLPGQSYTGWSDDELAAKNAECGTRINHMEGAVLVALSSGHDSAPAVAAATGLTRGQVQRAVAVLREQGLAALVQS